MRCYLCYLVFSFSFVLSIFDCPYWKTWNFGCCQCVNCCPLPRKRMAMNQFGNKEYQIVKYKIYYKLRITATKLLNKSNIAEIATFLSIKVNGQIHWSARGIELRKRCGSPVTTVVGWSMLKHNLSRVNFNFWSTTKQRRWMWSEKSPAFRLLTGLCFLFSWTDQIRIWFVQFCIGTTTTCTAWSGPGSRFCNPFPLKFVEKTCVSQPETWIQKNISYVML